MIRLAALLICAAIPAWAETVVPTRTIPARAIIMAEDLAQTQANIAGTVSDPAQIIGMEARVALFAGRPIRPGDVGQPAVVERNQIITMLYRSVGLTISTDGRALERASAGDVIRVMNLSSRQTVSAQIGNDGAAYVLR